MATAARTRPPPTRSTTTTTRRGSAAAWTPSAWSKLGVVAIFASGCGSCSACGDKKKDDAPISVPPPTGAASTEELTLGIGSARAIDDALAPSSTQWKRFVVLDAQRVALFGEITGKTIALASDNAGKTWRSAIGETDGWSSWTLGMDGTLVLALGQRGGVKSATGGTIESAKVSFSAIDKIEITPPIPLFPTVKGPPKGTLEAPSAIPWALGPNTTGLVGDDARTTTFFFGGRPGSEAVPPMKLPPGEKVVPVPYGRPPMLLSVRGRDLLVRPAPDPTKPLDKPVKVAGFVAGPQTLAELSVAPACERGAMSIQRVHQGTKLVALGISATKNVVVPLPDATLASVRVGCSDAKVMIAADDPIAKGLRFGGCDLDGKCMIPENTAVRPWAEPHEQDVAIAPTDKAILAVLSERAGDRWGLYLAESVDGKLFEQPRIVGEGKGRGQLELGAAWTMGSRALLLISADVTGTSRRGWYVIASDDGGLNWGPP